MVHSYSFEEIGNQLVPLVLRDKFLEKAYKENGKYLNLGCGKEYYKEPGWINLDGCEEIKADIHFDIDNKNLVLPFKTNEFDIVWASHILEHIWHLRALKLEVARILKVGGTFMAVVPYYLWSDAWGDDTHCRAFSEASFIGAFWPGFSIGQFGHMPTRNPNVEVDGNQAPEFWIWTKKEKL